MDESLESIWKTYSSILEWIKFSDTKAAVILTANGVILSITYSNISKFFSLLFVNSYSIIFFISLLIGIILSITSIVYSIKCLVPRTNTEKNNKPNLIYFKDINDHFDSSKQYAKTATKLFFNESELKDQLFIQIFVNSKIATIKYEKVENAIKFLGFGILFLVLPILILIINSIWGLIN